METQAEIERAIKQALIAARLPAVSGPEIPALAIRIWREKVKIEMESPFLGISNEPEFCEFHGWTQWSSRGCVKCNGESA